jgi:peptide/nickel transport system substrate-binding protein
MTRLRACRAALRRSRLLPLAGTLAVALLVAAGCTGGTPPSTPPSPVATPVAAHTVRAVTPSSFTTLDPARVRTSGDATLVTNVYQSMLAVAAGGTQPDPDLAEACKFTSPVVYSCRIRDKEAWSDGTPITPEQVKTSYDRLLRGPVAWAQFSGIVTSIQVVDQHSISFSLRSYNALLPYLLATPRAAIVRVGGGAATDPAAFVGSGPYLVHRFAPANQIVLARNEKYAGRTTARNDQVTITVERGAAKSVAAVGSNAADLAFGDLGDSGAGSATGSPPASPQVTVTSAPGRTVRLLVLRMAAGARGRAVHDAVARTIDRRALAAAVPGSADEAQTSVVPAGVVDHVDAFDESFGHTPDAVGAKAALDVAKVKAPMPLTLWCVTGDATCSTALRTVAAQLEASKLFTASVRTAPAAEIARRARAGGLDGWLATVTPAYPDADAYLAPVYGGGADSVVAGSGFASSALADDVRRSRQASVPATRADLLAGIQRQGSLTGPAIPLLQDRSTVVSRTGVTGIPTGFDIAGVQRFWSIRPPG